ncbi:hypothetical protein [Mechercharimyces sp. CAU 1602]|uniref:hypothetical protein n=1 Tax=Mechercharimyces sp. CAU 1602 TaxID=2973933 RepID=UPI002161FCF1|nr:hypothetical protein [Mechercharimyces sp. CAU 1602]MCS1351067.1 hypothetical protein [Mechercharimyces sp. CAU 1602]
MPTTYGTEITFNATSRYFPENGDFEPLMQVSFQSLISEKLATMPTGAIQNRNFWALYNTMSKSWQGSVIAQRGVNVPRTGQPIVRVNYAPTLSNIARVLFRVYSPLVRAAFFNQATLFRVTASSNVSNSQFYEITSRNSDLNISI